MFQRTIAILFFATSLSATTNISLKGKVVDAGKKGIAGASVSLVSAPDKKTATADDGTFTLVDSMETRLIAANEHTRMDVPSITLSGKSLIIRAAAGAFKGAVTVYSGNGGVVTAIAPQTFTAGKLQVAMPQFSPGLYLITVDIDGCTGTRKLITTGNGMYLSSNENTGGAPTAAYAVHIAQQPLDELLIEKTGYHTAKISIDSYIKENIEITLQKEGGDSVTCADFTVPAAFNETNPKMPDPFTFLDGTPMTRKEEWLCRRNEIRALAEATIYGTKPPKPDNVSATYSGGKLTITSTVGGNSESFSVTISDVPPGDGPHPAIINFGGGGMSIGPSVPAGVASISYPQDNVASEKNPRPAKGVFNNLYPELKSNQGALIGWAWGLSRIVDALEQPEIREATRIDATRLGTMGCSRWGKGAGMAVFDDRIMLPIILSPGSGFASTWRIAEVQTSSVQTASQIYGECTWMGAVFQKFGGSNVTKLPIDQHEIIAMRAPRPIVLLEGTNDSWNCPVCCYHAAKYASFVFEALGISDHFGWGHGNHGHCAQSGNSQQMKIMNAFIERFLLNKETSTEGMFNDSFTFDAGKWQDGDVPDLEGEPPDVSTILWKE
jgi:hypothetical protein